MNKIGIVGSVRSCVYVSHDIKEKKDKKGKEKERKEGEGMRRKENRRKERKTQDTKGKSKAGKWKIRERPQLIINTFRDK